MADDIDELMHEITSKFISPEKGIPVRLIPSCNRRGNEWKSAIWEHFDNEDDEKAKLVYCGKKLSFKGGCTGNLRHLKEKHKGKSVLTAKPKNTCPPNGTSTPSASRSYSLIESEGVPLVNSTTLQSNKGGKSKSMQFVTSWQEFEEIVRSHEINTHSKYVFYYGSFKKGEIKLNENSRLCWENNVPYFHFGAKVYVCQHGKDNNLYQKRKYAEKRDKKAYEDHIFTRRYKMVKLTKKLNCPVTFGVRKVFRVNCEELPESVTHYRKCIISSKIKKMIADGEEIIGVEGYFFNLPSSDEHKNHTVSELENAEGTRHCETSLPRERMQLINDCNSSIRYLQSVVHLLEKEKLSWLAGNLKELVDYVSRSVTTDECTSLPILSGLHESNDPVSSKRKLDNDSNAGFPRNLKNLELSGNLKSF